MPKILIIQGAGLDKRGKEHIDIFGPETLEEINAQITNQAQALGVDVELFQSNDEAEVIKRLSQIKKGDYDALLINPGGFTVTTGSLPQVIGDLPIPAFEIHASNPSSRKIQSTIQPYCKGSICGFGYTGYQMAMQAISNPGD